MAHTSSSVNFDTSAQHEHIPDHEESPRPLHHPPHSQHQHSATTSQYQLPPRMTEHRVHPLATQGHQLHHHGVTMPSVVHHSHAIHDTNLARTHDEHEHHQSHQSHEAHDSHDPHGSHQSHIGHCMSMAFHASAEETILIQSWHTKHVWHMVLSCLAVILLGIVYEAIKYYREWLFKNRRDKPQAAAADGSQSPKESASDATATSARGKRSFILSRLHFFQTFLYILQMLLSFLLMLIFMTFNVWLCIAVVLGAGIGYFIFFWRLQSYNVEHCA